MNEEKNVKRLLMIYVLVIAFFCPENVWAMEVKEGSMVKNISVEDGVFLTEFSPEKVEYSVYFEEFYKNVEVDVELFDTRFQYEIEGNRLLEKNKKNNIVVDVTDPQGEYEDERYTLQIVFETVGFTHMGAEKGILSPQFDKLHTNYYIVLENEIDTFEKIGLVWYTANKDAAVEIECKDELNEDGTLKEGERTQYTITVKESNGASVYYQLFVYRKESMVSALNDDALLENIKINGGAVKMTAFDTDRAFFDVFVPKTINKLDVQAYPVDKSNYVEVIGSTIMKEDTPIYITIRVVNEIKEVESYYTLRCQYDTVSYTEKYTTLQVISYAICSLVVGCLVGFAGRTYVIHKEKDRNLRKKDKLIES